MRGMGYVRVLTLRSRWLVAVVVAAMLAGSGCTAEADTAPLEVDLSALGLNNVGIELPADVWQTHVDLVCQGLETAATAARSLADDVGAEGQLEGFTATINAGVAASCPTAETSEGTALPEGAEAIALQARAMVRACGARMCGGRPVSMPVSYPDELLAALAEYEDFADIRQVAPDWESDPPLPDGAIWMTVKDVRAFPEVDGVVQVFVWAGLHGAPYLFQWQDDQWVDVEPEDLGVTVATSVS
jgi:hypothetical protein